MSSREDFINQRDYDAQKSKTNRLSAEDLKVLSELKTTTMNKNLAKELALIVAVLIREDTLNGTVFQVFDKAYGIAEEFVIAYPLDTEWGVENDLEYDETVINFAQKKLGL